MELFREGFVPFYKVQGTITYLGAPIIGERLKSKDFISLGRWIGCWMVESGDYYLKWGGWFCYSMCYAPFLST